jgi:hypothetical protein
VTGKVILDFGMAGYRLAKTCSGILVPIVPSAWTDKNTTHPFNLPDEFSSLHTT